MNTGHLPSKPEIIISKCRSLVERYNDDLDKTRELLQFFDEEGIWNWEIFLEPEEYRQELNNSLVEIEKVKTKFAELGNGIAKIMEAYDEMDQELSESFLKENS